MKITFMGAGSSVFAKNVLGDVLLTPTLRENLEIALYDIDGARLEESYQMIVALNKKYNEGKAKVEMSTPPKMVSTATNAKAIMQIISQLCLNSLIYVALCLPILR